MILEDLLEVVYYGTRIRIHHQLKGQIIPEFTLSNLQTYKEYSNLNQLLGCEVMGLGIEIDGTLNIDII